MRIAKAKYRLALFRGKWAYDHYIEDDDGRLYRYLPSFGRLAKTYGLLNDILTLPALEAKEISRLEFLVNTGDNPEKLVKNWLDEEQITFIEK